MRHSMSLKARQELLGATTKRYQKASKSEKKIILDEFIAATGYHRKYAIYLLNHQRLEQETEKESSRKPRKRKYDEDVQTALICVWEAANRICSKRLVPFLPELVLVMERFGHLDLDEDVRGRLLSISPSTADRLLYKIRRGRKGTGIGTTKPGALIKSQVPIRTFTEWDDAQPGFVEADLVAHCGTFTSGKFIQTLVMTDIASGWTEFSALLFRSEETVLGAIRGVRAQLPFDLLGLDTDNGTEFINYSLLNYCLDEEITFTRARPYKKNDQCFVEEKNGSIVRKFIGYDRFEGLEPYQILTALYSQLRLYVNFFQPSLKLIEKTRDGSKVFKKYDSAQTPHQRLKVTEHISNSAKQKLEEQYEALDPIKLLTNIQDLQNLLWPWAYTENTWMNNSKSVPPNQPKRTRRDDTLSSGVNKRNSKKTTMKPDVSDRMYRRTRKKRADSDGQRWWRTRVDPFEKVWPELEHRLTEQPDLSAKVLLEMLQEQHPDTFQDGQLRTLQRRVKQWLCDKMDDKINAENPYSISNEGDSG
jgi:hypothetical protein